MSQGKESSVGPQFPHKEPNRWARRIARLHDEKPYERAMKVVMEMDKNQQEDPKEPWLDNFWLAGGVIMDAVVEDDQHVLERVGFLSSYVTYKNMLAEENPSPERIKQRGKVLSIIDLAKWGEKRSMPVELMAQAEPRGGRDFLDLAAQRPMSTQELASELRVDEEEIGGVGRFLQRGYLITRTSERDIWEATPRGREFAKRYPQSPEYVDDLAVLVEQKRNTSRNVSLEQLFERAKESQSIGPEGFSEIAMHIVDAALDDDIEGFYKVEQILHWQSEQFDLEFLFESQLEQHGRITGFFGAMNNSLSQAESLSSMASFEPVGGRKLVQTLYDSEYHGLPTLQLADHLRKDDREIERLGRHMALAGLLKMDQYPDDNRNAFFLSNTPNAVRIHEKYPPPPSS